MKRKPTLRIYRNRAGRWNWTLRAANGEPLAQGCGEAANGFASARSAWRNLLIVTDALAWREWLATSDRLPGKGATVLEDPDGYGITITRDHA
jgi:uncharacterized protein YegP (UPF0339 family)